MTWKQFEIKPAFASPYSDWRTETDFDLRSVPIAQREQLWRPLSISGFPRNIIEFLKANSNDLNLMGSDDNPEILVSEHFTDLANFNDEYLTVVAHVTQRFAKALSSEWKDNDAIKILFEDGSPVGIEFGPPTTFPIAARDSLQIPNESEAALIEVPDGTVILAIIDDVIGFANARFRSSELNTRIGAFWNMDTATSTGSKVLSAVDMNDMLVANAYLGSVDEISLYKSFVHEYSTGTKVYEAETHGTHVLDLMAGYDFTDATDAEHIAKRPILAVQLPRHAVLDSSGTASLCFVEEAVQWILLTADRFRTVSGKQVPLVTNFSFGLYAGSHDGRSAYERNIQRIPDRTISEGGKSYPSVATLPSGNSFGSRTHAYFELEPTKPQLLHWQVYKNSTLAGFIEFWLPESNCPENGLSSLTLRITPPDSDDVLDESGLQTFSSNEAVPLGMGGEWLLGDDQDLTLRTYHQFVPNESGQPKGLGRERVMVAILPTEPSEFGDPAAPSGEWEFEVSVAPASVFSGPIHAWIQRGGNVFGGPSNAIQSIFNDPKYDTSSGVETDSNDSYVKREGTLNALATANGVICVGGHESDSVNLPSRPPRYASSGSSDFDHQHRAPLLALPTNLRSSGAGIPAAGTYSNTAAWLNGTSAASPQLARQVADLIEQGLAPTTNIIDELIEMAEQDTHKPTGSDGLDPYRIGHGRLPWKPI